MNNRKYRREWFKQYKKRLQLTSWKEFNDTTEVQQPYVNPNKKHVYDTAK